MPQRKLTVRRVLPENARDTVGSGGEGLSGPAAVRTVGALGRDRAVGGKLPEAEAGVGVVPKKLGQVVAADGDGDR